jgi:hypothetical protein
MPPTSKIKANLPVYPPKGAANPYEFCKLIQPQLGIALSDFLTLDVPAIRRILFVNGGWRLTNTGRQMVTDIYFTYRSKHENNNIVTGRVLLNMDRICNGPWGLHGEWVTVLDTNVNFELQMFDGKLSELVNFRTRSY